MTHLLKCPVCEYTEISENSCPNCDADLSLIRSLIELSPSHLLVEAGLNSTPANIGHTPSSLPARFWRTGWQVGAALLILMIGVCLGTIGSFLFLQPSQLLSTGNSESQVTVREDTPPASISQEAVKPQQPTQYTVKPGDNLTAITEKFCGEGKPWQVMVKANPQLQSRPDLINVGEVLQLPNCEG